MSDWTPLCQCCVVADAVFVGCETVLVITCSISLAPAEFTHQLVVEAVLCLPLI